MQSLILIFFTKSSYLYNMQSWGVCNVYMELDFGFQIKPHQGSWIWKSNTKTKMKWFITMNNRAQTHTMRTLQKEKQMSKTEKEVLLKWENKPTLVLSHEAC